MYQFDSALREAFESGVQGGDDSVVFIERDPTGAIRPCAPNKILITSTETIRRFGRYLPLGFQTKSRSTIRGKVNRINELVATNSNNDLSKPFLITVDTAIEIVKLIGQTIEYDEKWDNIGYEWDIDAFEAIIRRLVDNIQTEDIKGKIYCYAQVDRNISRLINNNTSFTDSPDDGQTDLPIAQGVATETPCLILLGERGLSANGWRDAEFWWPVLIAPANAKTAIFAKETTS